MLTLLIDSGKTTFSDLEKGADYKAFRKSGGIIYLNDNPDKIPLFANMTIVKEEDNELFY